MTAEPREKFDRDDIEAYLLGQLPEDRIALLDEVLRTDAALLLEFAWSIQVMSLVRQEFAGREQYQAVHRSEPLLEDFKALLQQMADMEKRAHATLVDRTPVHRQLLPQLRLDEVREALGVLASLPVVWGAVAAVLALTFTLVFVSYRAGDSSPALVQHPVSPSPSDRPAWVATLTGQTDAVWEKRPAKELYAGQRLTLNEGFAQITTHRGAKAILEAPCTIELTKSDNEFLLVSGKLVGLCHTKLSTGFVVKTPYADITDLGTEFGVTVTPAGVEASVFVGEVAVKTPDAPSKLITQSQTAKVMLDRGQPEVVVVDTVAQGYFQRLPREPLISAARINDPRFKVEVVPQGMFEDVKSCTDRDYELNGVDEKGLPRALIGGDLVRMPANARPEFTPDINDISVQIDLAKPADIYIVLQQQSEVPQWILEDYTKTDMVVGIDWSGNYKNISAQNAVLGVGPGASIDSFADVWQRKEPAAGTLTTGALPELKGIYYIVAQEHASEE